MNFPATLKYTKSHEWVRVDGNVATVGITDHAQHELGDIVFVEVTKAAGASIKKGDGFGAVESVKTLSDVYAPVSGTIKEVNGGLSDSPEKVNESPYEEAWMVQIELSDPKELDDLMDAAAYQEFLASDAH